MKSKIAYSALAATVLLALTPLRQEQEPALQIDVFPSEIKNLTQAGTSKD